MTQATPRPWTITTDEVVCCSWINDAKGKTIAGFVGEDSALGQEIVRAVNREPLFDDLVDALDAMAQNFKPFTTRPVYATHSQARLEQKSQIEAYTKALAILEKVKS